MTYLVGRGIADITGEIAECGLLGYGKAFQRANGLHTRLRSRAFVIVDEDSAHRILLSVNDLPMVFDSIYREVLRRLANAYGELYSDENVTIAATHTHCGPGGYSYHRMYNSNTGGFRSLTFGAIVDGMVQAIGRAHNDVAPARLTLGHGRLADASVNRSRSSFLRNPAGDREFFPEGIDTQSTVLGIQREGRLVGAINWFATHGTSMTNRNRLVSGDNKGYAAYHWERVVHGIDYVDDTHPDFIGAFAQTNAGDMSPNLHQRPGSGPTEDEFENTRIIGERQFAAAAAATSDPAVRTMDGPIDTRTIYVDMAAIEVGPDFTGDGQTHRTGPGCAGAAALAGTDEGPAFRAFKQGRNRIVDALSRHVVYRLFPSVGAAQAPKGIVVPGGWLNRVVPISQNRVPVQLIRIGLLYLIAIPGEVTIVAGLRLRRLVAGIVGADVADVLITGYANAYIHYVTTPEEYDNQRYEGGSTLYGRWELGAVMQTVAGLATSMRDGVRVPIGERPPAISVPHRHRDKRDADEAPAGGQIGDVLVEPRPAYGPGQQVRAVFAGAYPNNALRRGGTYLAVERQADGAWTRVADDGDWSTKLGWSRHGRNLSQITVTWDIPAAAEPGRYRLAYFGDARDEPGDGPLRAIAATSAEFDVG